MSSQVQKVSAFPNRSRECALARCVSCLLMRGKGQPSPCLSHLEDIAVEGRLATRAHEPQDRGAMCASWCSCEDIPIAWRLRHLAPRLCGWVVAPDLHCACRGHLRVQAPLLINHSPANRLGKLVWSRDRSPALPRVAAHAHTKRTSCKGSEQWPAASVERLGSRTAGIGEVNHLEVLAAGQNRRR